jgi:hypothetical protein
MMFFIAAWRAGNTVTQASDLTDILRVVLVKIRGDAEPFVASPN